MRSVTYDAIVVGSGAAGFNAACQIAQLKKQTVAIVTEGVLNGTSRNAGSDMQIYYKLGLGADMPDSVRLMAQKLFDGGCVDGDNALCEAALSVRCFTDLCREGVAFPVNRYGEYIGYKTDEDPSGRSTSAGQLTSRQITEALENKASELNIPVYDQLYVVELLKDKDGICGLLCIDKTTGRIKAFRTAQVVLATGGPAGIYADSAYPGRQFGSSALAFRAGAAFQNVTEWQYGLASTQPRWNISGAYLQALPRFVSVDEQGNEHEFLAEYFSDPYEALSCVFRKGSQWLFDSAKVMAGTSVIDLLVYTQTVILGRKVYLDYRKNPFSLETIEYAQLSKDACEYLKKADACFGTPIERLMRMNAPAVGWFRDKGVDLKEQMLPIALCAQHNNGGISVDRWWQTSVPGLFAVGECAGTHGISCPSGSALNAGQVGALRAAQYMSQHKRPLSQDFEAVLWKRLAMLKLRCTNFLNNPPNVSQQICDVQKQMSACGAAIREKGGMEKALQDIKDRMLHLEETVGVGGQTELYQAFRLEDILLCQLICLEAMLDYLSTVGATRGSALYTDPNGDKRRGMDETFRFSCVPMAMADRVQQGMLKDGVCKFIWRPVRSIPNQSYKPDVCIAASCEAAVQWGTSVYKQ